MVRLVDEEHTGFPGLPGAVDDLREYIPGVHRPDDITGARMDQVVVRALPLGAHERVRDRNRDVEVGDLGDVILARDEFQDIRMIDPQDTHVGPAPRATLLHDVRGCVVERHERHRSRSDAHRGADDVVSGA